MRAASETTAEDEGKLFADDQRPSSPPCSTPATATTSGAEVELAVDPQRLHFFDPATGLALAGASRSSQFVS